MEENYSINNVVSTPKQIFIEEINNYCSANSIDYKAMYKKLINSNDINHFAIGIKMVIYDIIDINYTGDKTDNIRTPHILDVSILERRLNKDKKINRELKLLIFNALLQKGANPDQPNINGISFRDKLEYLLDPKNKSDKDYVILKTNGREVFELINQKLTKFDKQKQITRR